MSANDPWHIRETYTIEKHKSNDGKQTYINNYELLQTLGHGAFAKVKLCRRITQDDRPSRHFALKIFSKRELMKQKEYTGTNATPMRSALDRVRDEIAIMRVLYHRNIVLLFEVLEDERNDKLYMVTEYMSGGPCMTYRADTKDFVSPITNSVLSEELAKAHVRDVLNGLAYLHARNVCHRDVKPDNILLNEEHRCHLTDFGCAMVATSTQETVSDTIGTYQFLAPECCSGDPFDPFKVDIWAVGVVLYVFLFGRLPFDSENLKDLMDEILQSAFHLPTDTRTISDDCSDLLKRLLTSSPDDRITLQEALEHPWLQEEDEPLSF